MAGPLAGIKVVDCSAYITGPLATMILGDQGADVIKVEPLAIGDIMRHLGTQRGGISAVFAGCNRSKRSLPLNLREPAGRDRVGRDRVAIDPILPARHNLSRGCSNNSMPTRMASFPRTRFPIEEKNATSDGTPIRMAN